jgi:hypothetical protein
MSEKVNKKKLKYVSLVNESNDEIRMTTFPIIRTTKKGNVLLVLIDGKLNAEVSSSKTSDKLPKDIYELINGGLNG